MAWEPSPSLIAQLVEAGQPFWLDIENPTDEVIDQLATRLGLHPLAVRDSRQFGQRTKLQVYGNGVMLVGFGLDEQLREPVEVHCYYTTGFLITLRSAASPALDAVRQAGSVQPQLGSDPIRALYPLISSLYTQFSALALELGQAAEVTDPLEPWRTQAHKLGERVGGQRLASSSLASSATLTVAVLVRRTPVNPVGACALATTPGSNGHTTSWSHQSPCTNHTRNSSPYELIPVVFPSSNSSP